MDISRKSCRICLSETEFNVPLYGSYCRRTNMVDKILVCVKLVIEETDILNTICYKCAENIEGYYNFIMFVRKSQLKLIEPRPSLENSLNRRHVTYVREQVIDADYTFSFLEIPNNDEKRECKGSSPFFSYYSPPNTFTMPKKGPKKESNYSSPFFSYISPPNVLIKQSAREHVLKTLQPRQEPENQNLRREDKIKYKRQCQDRPQRHSGDLFDSQSQDVDEFESRPLDWKLTPDDNIIKRVRDKCFGRSDF